MDKNKITDDPSQRPNNNWKSFLWTLALLLILNSLVFPNLFKPKIIPTTYSAFINKVDSGLIKQVNIDGNKIYFATPGDTIDRKGDTIDLIFQTGKMNDANLVDRLLVADSPNENGKIEFTETIPRENSPILSFLLYWVLPGAIFFFIWRNAMKSMGGRMGGNYMSFGKNKEKIYAEDEIKTTFADVAGQDEAKESLNEIIDFLHNPKKYNEMGAALPKGVLLVGPPGTGKTLIARAVAGEAKVPFFALSGSEFVQMFVGMGAAKVRDLFSQANQKAPCIIFIDEIDAIGKRRDGMTSNDEREQTLNQLLTEMDGFDGRKGVVILAATNRPESLDKALLRPGRFDRRVQMELPDLEGRKAILQVHLKKVKHEEIDLDLIARATSGASGAELANIVNEAALRAVRNESSSVTTADLEESIETVIAGAQRKGKVISDEEKRIIAYHEIGHAMVAAMQSHSAPVHKITIIPRTSGALGYTMQIDEGERNLYSKEDLENRIATFTGGRAAEEVIFNRITTGASNDIEQATKIARAMITRYGMSEEFDMVALETINNPYLSSDTSLSCSPETAARIDDVVLSIVKNAHEKAKKIIRENEAKMHELSEYLIKKETITGEEFMKILEAKK
ncbi:MAG: ATP-dependent zinc metalloprotease FtsH [Bacteroidales bacterium]|jgi:cell division protease FtsH|nr:ATP-dependent zinc metalloprotease FtsH [Bacteroidales bacterium]MDI9544489.1 ATP-dependent zinc metalloprotease FtsH [Bacteroidota bacterium]OQC02250.1 MAG: ATP-dependent zinc metalloprotease FtsH 4 [Bacteroidetes bacterium ADurb.Bin090]MBP8982510.1 ATP-dependent zinc metalloprotease FtsH [Bacteroidales bacterium]NLV38359.1 ATP-dependent zinc metalloprotease FtsH [Bacteroidales bacterium]